MSTNQPIGVFDTGVGGLSVVREILNFLPQERIIYFADRARQPYGALPKQVAESLVLESLEFLVERGVKALVIACNTAAAAGFEAAREYFDIPIISVIEPGVREAALVTKNKRVGVIGTKGTIESKAHAKLFSIIDPEITVYGQSCPLLPPLIELGELDTGETQAVIKQCLEPLKQQGIDTLVLGCTHFPFVRSFIQQTIGTQINIVDPALETARLLKQTLEQVSLLKTIEDGQDHRFLVSKFPATFHQVGSLLLGRKLPPIEECSVGKPVQDFEIFEKELYDPKNRRKFRNKNSLKEDEG